MIGYYVHHHGRGHLARALAIIAALDARVTILSSLPRPNDMHIPWVSLPRDDDDEQRDQDAGGRLHWAPLNGRGFHDRMAAISRWISYASPEAMVVDVSVEVTLLARLHGVPVVTVALPGGRGDAAHAIAFDVSTAIIAAWPAEAENMVSGLSDAAARRLRPVGAISRFASASTTRAPRSHAGNPIRSALVLGGGDADDFSSGSAVEAQSRTPGWSWTYLGGSSGRWAADPWDDLLAADVVITHAGESSIADVSAARRPAIVVPQRRPHDEQVSTARALAFGSWPVVIAPDGERDWGQLLESATAADGDRWRSWNDGLGAARAAAVIDQARLPAGVIA